MLTTNKANSRGDMIRTCDLLVPNPVAFADRKNKERITAARQGVYKIICLHSVGVNRSFRSFIGENKGERYSLRVLDIRAGNGMYCGARASACVRISDKARTS